MQHLFRFIIVGSILLSTQALASQTIYKVLEQDDEGVASHRALDRTLIGDGIDPVLQFIMLDSPTEPDTAQLLWVASEKPIPWARTAEVQSYRMIEYADLPEGSRLEYRIFTHETGDELTALRHVRSADDGDYGVDPTVINELPDAVYDLHVHLLTPDRPTQILKQLVDVSDFAIDPNVDEAVGLENEEDVAPKLEPGDGFKGKTKQPANIGDSKAIAMAHWNVVPEQAVKDGFTVGVIAHHAHGIDRVEISANGGEWVKITEQGVNPRTNCMEYFAELTGLSGELELRAIAYPKQGKPRLLEPLTLFVGEHVGKIIELDAGTHSIRDLRQALPERGWLVIKAKDGLSRDQVKLINGGHWAEPGRLKIQGVTWTAPYGQGMLAGAWEDDDRVRVWLDDVEIIGNGEAEPTNWIAHMWSHSYFTNCKISKVQNVFHGSSGQLLARNVEISDTYEDVFRSMGLAVNVTIDDLGRRSIRDAHPDLIVFDVNRTQSNIIFQDVTIRNSQAHGMYGGNVDGVAMIRVDIETRDMAAFAMGRSMKNTLIEDCRFVATNSGEYFFPDIEPENVVLRRSKFGNNAPWLPDGSWREGIEAQSIAK